MADKTSQSLPDGLSTFHYTLLQDSRSFRLAKLCESSPETPVSLEISIHSLDNPPEYQVLSYVWGPPYQEPHAPNFENTNPASEEIICNGKLFWVFPNLRDALAMLPRTSLQGFIWIDALCIDQASNEEKSSQVTLMGEIYGLASVVVIWLGPATSESKVLQWAITELSHALVTALDRNPQQMSSITSPLDVRLYSLLDVGDAALVQKKLKHFVTFVQSLRYFRRTRVMQEVALARRVRTFCGPDYLNLFDLLHLWSYMAQNGWLASLLDMFIPSIHQMLSLNS
jgi:hypothetical protein